MFNYLLYILYSNLGLSIDVFARNLSSALNNNVLINLCPLLTFVMIMKQMFFHDSNDDGFDGGFSLKISFCCRLNLQLSHSTF